MTWSINRNRNVRREVTFTPEEWEQAEDLWLPWKDFFPSYSGFARRMLMRGEVPVTTVRPLTDPAPIAKEIGRIGVNINQIAHWANQSQGISRADVDAIMKAQEDIDRLVSRLFRDQREAQQRAEGR